jgi:hypothetical protein
MAFLLLVAGLALLVAIAQVVFFVGRTSIPALCIIFTLMILQKAAPKSSQPANQAARQPASQPVTQAAS